MNFNIIYMKTTKITNKILYFCCLTVILMQSCKFYHTAMFTQYEPSPNLIPSLELRKDKYTNAIAMHRVSVVVKDTIREKKRVTTLRLTTLRYHNHTIRYVKELFADEHPASLNVELFSPINRLDIEQSLNNVILPHLQPINLHASRSEWSNPVIHRINMDKCFYNSWDEEHIYYHKTQYAQEIGRWFNEHKTILERRDEIVQQLLNENMFDWRGAEILELGLNQRLLNELMNDKGEVFQDITNSIIESNNHDRKFSVQLMNEKDEIFQDITNSIMESDNKTHGYITYRIDNIDLRLKFAYFIPSILTGFTINLLGFPGSQYQKDISLTVTVFDKNWKEVRSYSSSARKSAYSALYWGYGGGHIPRAANAKAFSTALTNIMNQIQNDSEYLNTALKSDL